MKKLMTFLFLIPVLMSLCTLGCATNKALTVSESYITEHQKEWLSRGYRYDRNGWIFLHTEGKPFERGFQRGYLTAHEIDDFLKTAAYVQKFETARDQDFFVKSSADLFGNKVSGEYVEEMRGIAAGMEKAGIKATYEEILYMNGFIDILYWWPIEKDRSGPGCSAFIATGGVTLDGRIVMVHNTWEGYALGRFCNLIVEIIPDTGNRILMQSSGPCIYSTTDFFITSAGLIGVETTIGGFNGFNRKGLPVFERARKAMQYANSIDEWSQIMINSNNGAYANSWLIGDIKTNEIARLELGLKHHSLERKADGYFTGSNVTENIEILRNETDAPYDDLRNTCVARRVRWNQLMKKYYGTIDTEIAKLMLGDHYDVYLGKENPCSRTICGHGALDDGSVPGSSKPYRPGGVLDGKVVDANMAKNWQFWAKWGSSCNIGFNAEQFLAEQSQYEWMKGYLKDLPSGPWTVFPEKKQ